MISPVVRCFGGFAEDVKTDEEAMEVLRRYAGTDQEAWKSLLKNEHIIKLPRILAQVQIELGHCC